MTQRPWIMGIVNITPDSFSDGGRLGTSAIEHAITLISEGAAVLDLGGESTRPGASEVSEAEELARILPVLTELRRQFPSIPISIDTRRARTAARTLECGATLINDVRAGQDPDMFRVVAQAGCEVILMHSRGTPATMAGLAHYQDPVAEVWGELEERRNLAIGAGIAPHKILLDPGIGFAKELMHNLAILRDLVGRGAQRILVGASRKRLIGELSGEKDPQKRLAGSLAVAIWAAQAGVEALRVHDVAATRQALAVWSALSSVSVADV